MTADTAATTFADLGVSEPVVAALGKGGIETAFPIQTASIQAALDGRDICGKAPTGSGKTLAFGIPAIELSSMGTPWHPAVLILSPTRELATQIKDELEPLATAKDRTIVTVFGGTNIERDIKRLEKGVDILVACPGRLEDLIGRRCCDLRNVELVVVDEADRMADMGFLPAVKRLLDQTPGNRHTLLFSATLDGDVDMLIKRYQNDPLTFEVEEQVGEIGDVEHSWYLVQPVDRIPHAIAVLQRYESSIVFCRTRRGCDRVAKVFAQRGVSAVAIHGDRSQHQRERALADFTSGNAQVLVATDVAARGIHVDNVALVMHYDPAGSDKDYIHRSGRTGRAGQDGRVISMVVEDKKKAARQLQKDLGIKPGLDVLDVASLGPIVARPKPTRPKPKPTPKAERKGGGNKRGDRNSGGSRDKPKRGDRNSGGSRDKPKRGDRNTSRGNRGERRPDGKRKTPRRGANDWYPPGHDENTRDRGRSTGSKGSGGKKRSSGSSRDGEREDRSADDPNPGGRNRAGRSTGGRSSAGRNPGGRNSAKRKSRGAKGRHADKSSSKNKGKRRNPRSR